MIYLIYHIFVQIIEISQINWLGEEVSLDNIGSNFCQKICLFLGLNTFGLNLQINFFCHGNQISKDSHAIFCGKMPV